LLNVHTEITHTHETQKTQLQHHPLMSA